MTETTVKLSLDQYCPEIDLSQVTMWDAMKLVDLLAATSTIINAAIAPTGVAPAVSHYLDHWQALINAAVFEIADVVETMRPSTVKEQNARNWLLAHVHLPCAEGLISITGPGLPESYSDAFSAGLIARKAASK